MRHVFRLALGGLALYFYSQGNLLWAALCVLALLWSVLQQDIARLFSLVARLTHVPLEHDANCILSYTISLNQVFEHPAVSDLFAKLHEKHKAPVESLEKWRKLLAESYARKYKRDDLVWEVRFNIKSSLLFVNGEPSFRDYICDELEIPYRWTEGGEPQEAPFMAPDIESELTVRTLLLNGMLLLQVGRFSKEYSPNILRPDGLAAYETYATITSFPLMYFSEQHGIPARYLTLIAQGIPSYKAYRYGHGTSKTSDAEWRMLNQDFAAYRTLCDSAGKPWGEYDYDTVKKLWKQFEAKRQPLLDAEGYQTLEDKSDDDWYPDLGHTYWNKYGQVFFRNMNANRDSEHETEWLAGYHEERP